MATYVWNPNSINTGVNPIGNGWTYRTTNQYSTSTISLITTPVGDRAWELSTTSTSNLSRLVSFDDIATSETDMEVLSLQRRTSSTAGIGNLHRISGAAGSQDGYFFGLRNNATERRGRFWTGGSQTNFGSETHGFTTTVDTWFWIRSNVFGTTHRMKIWEDGTTEPVDWTLEQTDSAHSSGGAGLGDFLRDTGGTVHVAWFSVGTAGDPAPDTEAVPRKITITDLKDPNAANAQVKDATGVQVKLWIDKDDVGAPDVLVTDATVTGGTMEVTFNSLAAVGDPVLGVAKWEDSNETYFFPIDTTVQEDV